LQRRDEAEIIINIIDLRILCPALAHGMDLQCGINDADGESGERARARETSGIGKIALRKKPVTIKLL
jgi:hypothetical protein